MSRTEQTQLWESIAITPALCARLEALLGDGICARLNSRPLSNTRLLALLKDDWALRKALEDEGVPRDRIDTFQRELSKGTLIRSFLPPKRVLEILCDLAQDLPAYELSLANDRAQHVDDFEGPSPEDMGKAQWSTVATTPPTNHRFDSKDAAKRKAHALAAHGIPHDPVRQQDGMWLVRTYGCRVSFAFYKKMCVYKKEHEGCRHCELSAKNRRVKESSTELQLAALEDALAQTEGWQGGRTVFEILPDGSFLNPYEVPYQVQQGMLERLALAPDIQRVSVETRPEYCDPPAIRRLLGYLRPDQFLEIYFGLETTDDFMGGVVIKKGYVFADFKAAVLRLQDGLSPDELRRIQVTAYHFIKAPYLTDAEAIEAAVRMAEDIDLFCQSSDIEVPIEIKYEPAIISTGTFQAFLYDQREPATGKRRSEPLSYFSVAEIIARLIEKNLHHRAKFGQRDDIDDYTTVAMVSSLEDENMFSPFDFLVYNAVQRFNARRDVEGFAFDCRLPVLHSQEFPKWQEETMANGHPSSLHRLVHTRLEQAPTVRGATGVERESFQKAVWQVCDEIEYSESLAHLLLRRGSQALGQLVAFVQTAFEDRGIHVYCVKEPVFIDIGEQKETPLPTAGTAEEFRGRSVKSGFQTEIIIYNEASEPQSVWVKIPLVAEREPPRVPCIYE